jgi:autotransporter-associated beta strand protein
MKLKNVLLNTLCALAFAGTVTMRGQETATTVSLTSGDAGGGLTLNPANVVVALHFSNVANNYAVQGVNFTNINSVPPNNAFFAITPTGSWNFQQDFGPSGTAPGVPAFGSGGSVDSTNLAKICNGFYFGSDSGNGFNFVISGLAPYSTNKIEFIHYLGSPFGSRPMIITVTDVKASLSQTNNEGPSVAPLNSQFSGFVANGAGQISGRFYYPGSPGSQGWINAVVVTFQGQGPIPTYTWSGASNGNWDITKTTNWISSLTGASVWTNGFITRFDDTATGATTVNETTNLSPISLTVSNNTASYTFTGNGGINGVRLLKQGAGLLTIQSTNSFSNGASEVQSGTVAFSNSSSNKFTTDLWVGSGATGNGTVNVQNTAKLSLANVYVAQGTGSTGSMTLGDSSGANMGAINVGYGASSIGSMTFGGSAVITNSGAVSVGVGSGASGALAVQDSAVHMVASGDYLIGQSSTGSLLLTNNAQVIYNTPGNWVRLAENAGSVATINQYSGTVFNMQSSGEFRIGDSGTATWNQYGGTVTNNSWVSLARVGAASSGTLNVSGGIFDQHGSANQITVGEQGIGTLNVSGNGQVVVEGSGGLVIVNASTATGTVNLNGGTVITKKVTTGASTQTSFLYFNGGTLKAGPGASSTFMTGLWAAIINSGAIIDDGGNNITINQELYDGGFGGGLTKLGTGTLTLLQPLDYLGTTTVSNGTLAITTLAATDGGFGGPVVVVDNAALGIQVMNANQSVPASSLTLGNLTGATLTFNLGNFGNPSVAPLNVSGNVSVNGTNIISIADALPQLGEFPLIQYGSLSGSGCFVLGAVPVGVAATIVTNTVNNSIDLNITTVNLPEWAGLAGGNWDVGLTTNWIVFGAGNPTYFAQGNTALFDDSAPGTTTVNLVGTLNPAAVTITNDSLNYFFKGSGSIGGSGGLTKQGTGSLIITNTSGNTYTGATVLQGGTVTVNSLANGGATSAIGASSSNPTNLVFAGGTLSYQGSPVAINRGYAVQGVGGTLSLQSNLTLSGFVTAASGSGFVKTGPATLTYTTVGSNALSGGAFPGYDVSAGTVIFDGTGGQTNVVNGEFWAGDATAGNVSIVLSNTVLNASTYVSVGRNAAAGNVSSLTLTNATLSQGNGLALGYYDTPFTSPLISTQIVTVSGSSTLNTSGDAFIADFGGSAGTLNAKNTSAVVINGNFFVAPRAYTDGTLNISDSSVITINNPGGGGVFVAGYNTWWGGDALSKTGRVNQVGGNFTVTSGDLQIGSQGDGTWNLSGGSVVANGWTSIGRFPAGVGHLNISGGTFTQTGLNGNALIIAEEGLGTMTVTGSGLVNCLGSQGLIIGGSDGVSTPGYGTVNLNGGTIVTKSVNLAGVGYSTGTMNFNGGVLKANASNANFMSTLTAANVLAGGVVVDSDTNNITIGQALLDGGTGGGLTKFGAGTLNLSGVNTYTGLTAVSNGILLVSGTIAGNATVSTGATLGGAGGTIGGAVTIGAGGTFAPGGTITVGSVLTFNSGAAGLFMLNKLLAPSNDLAIVSGTITANGSLTVTNLGPALIAGDSFKLFSHAVSGSFSLLTLPGLTAGLGWTNRLGLDGSLVVIATVNPNPTNITATVSGSNLTLSWPTDHTGWRLQVQTNSLSVGLNTNWVDVVGATATNQVVIPISQTNPTVFYRMAYP